MKELVFWIGVLVVFSMASPPPFGVEHLGTLCPLAALGFSHCPGCGLGRSLIYLLHGQFSNSIQQHWFGFPALLILVSRIVQLVKLNRKLFILKYKEKKYV